MLAGHGAARVGAGAAVVRFAEGLGIPVATTFHGKGVIPDDHPLALGAVGFMRHDYVNFGFDRADVIIAVGYELQEFDPARINPRGDTKIIHLHRFPAEVDAHFDVAVGLHADMGRSLDALAAAVGPREAAAAAPPAAASGSASCCGTSWSAAATTTASPWPRRASSPTPARRSTATTSCSSTPARSRCGWPGCTRPTSRTPA